MLATPNKTSSSSLKLLSLKEDPQQFEEVIVKQQELYEKDDQIKQLLDSIFLEKNRDASFNRFLNSLEFKTITKLLTLFKATKNNRVCEIGGGPGFLTWALSQIGYKHLDLVEPNNKYNTGTGYLSSRSDTNDITIFTDLHEWDANGGPYDTVITKNCIHHFQNIAMSAAIIRQRMQPGGLWFSFREWFADTPQELYSLLNSHPYSQPYNIYEWPYPAAHYAEAIEIAGFKLIAVIPYDYANNCLGTWSEGPVPNNIKELTDRIDHLLEFDAAKTVDKFWEEIQQNKFHGTHHRFYTRPQMMLFQKIDV